tara:strand:- start:223 stop:1041 length:819 start_codon:yes stop_codon:yes gene_type:complete
MNNKNIFYSENDLKKMKLVKQEVIKEMKFNEYISLKISQDPENKKKYTDFSKEILEEYPSIKSIQETTYFYKNKDGKIIKEIKKTMKSKISKKSVKKHINPFGDALKNNDDIVTTLSPTDVFIEPVKKYSKHTIPVPEPVLKKDLFGKKINKGSKFKIFSINDSLKNKFKDENKKSGGYKPPGFNNEKNTIVLKNLPEIYVNKDFEYDIKNQFSEFGTILKIKILSNRNNKICKGIGFIDFVKKESVSKVLESKIKFKLCNQIIMVEKKKIK